jgi:hypothetical protein
MCLLKNQATIRTFYYYTIDIGDICIMSNADDEAIEKGWVAIFDSIGL